MQAEKEEPAAPAAAGEQPSICDRLQKAFHARPAFQPLRRLTVRHKDGGGAAKPAAAGAGDGATSAAPGPAPKRSGPPLPAAPPATAPQSEQPVPVRLPAVTSKVAATSKVPTGPPVPVPPPDVTAGMATPAADTKSGEEGQKTKGKTRVGSRVHKALSSK